MQESEEAAMHRRFLFPLAAAVVGLVAIAPVFAAEPSPSAAGKPSKKTSSESGKPAKDSTSSTEAGSGSDSGSPAAGPDETGSDSPDSSAAGSNNTSTTAKGGTPPSTGAGSHSGSKSGSAGSGGTSSTTCAPPATDQGPAPQVGEAPQNHAAGDAGNVDVERLSATELRIAKATANDGWMQQVTAPSGPRVSVKFTRPGQSPSLMRFAASMDQAGRVIHIRVTSCG
jgi:hypothetical protein